MSTHELMRKALLVLERVCFGQRFRVRYLFEEHEWEAMSKGVRLSFGKFFKEQVLAGNVPNVRYLGKADNNSAEYIKEEQRDETTGL